ncbi:hypothetical protein I302_100167 [Kwoniella bestiolae CBS 10118]|uniref:FHA domain-containing protein n=1 Tax=Kwoniella bestiolae CBS 10118 TaxID=1296100 RepID=A0A1B9G4E8_9TREE|nr:hypothetical protein I302_03542 [Kwoniella bestiolae CBS 10118]OCF25868.1 hypothetical protein I302_03542 [Kwoniella bestiolae CBS 10118]
MMQHPSQSYVNQNQGQGGQANGGVPWGGPFPSLHLWPLQDTFVMKMIHLGEGQRIKIGRQTNTKTVPGERNAYFDSKVLSRLHAEIWEQGGKIFIKDVRSSNGTFINGERLSPESVESEPFELKNEDQVEFGIDIVSEDNRTIVHHKVAAKVYCVFTPEDAALSARELANYQNQDTRGARRLPPQQNGHVNNQLSQMGPAIMSSGGKSSGLSFDHVLTKLQNELRASKETGTELQNLATAFTDIQDTLGGGLPPAQNGSAAQFIPPQFRSASAEAQAALAGPHGQQAAAFIALQSQLTETQTSLGSQLEKIRLLEDQLKEHETIKSEISSMREQMEESKREMDLLLASGGNILSGGSHGRGRPLTRRNEDDDDDDDDTRSVMTLMDNEESEQRVRDRRRAEREAPDSRRDRDRSGIERPRTPEPTNLNGDSGSDEDEPPSTQPNGIASTSTSRESEIIEQNAELVGKIAILSAEIQEAVTISQTLRNQHSEAMSAVKLLTERVGALETGIASKVAEEVEKAEQRWEVWKIKFEEGWKKERESWDTERERLRGVVREWEEASRRAHEEEEERELNESLSEDELDDEEEDENAEDSNEVLSLDGWQEDGSGGNSVGAKLPSLSNSKKSRRRRSSQKALLAVQALRNVSDPSSSSDVNNNNNGGSSTPKSISSNMLDNLPSINGQSSSVNNQSTKLKNRNKKNNKQNKNLLRSGLSRTIQLDEKEKENSNSSESGRESVSTLKDGDEDVMALKSGRNGGKNRDKQDGQVIRPVPVFTVLVVLVAAGVYWHKFHKD